MVIKQGDLFWVELDAPRGHEPAFRHPHVVVQSNLFNQSHLNTVLLCTLTSNLNLAKAPGNVLLKKGEANLSKASVVNVAQIITVNKRDLEKKLGTLSPARVREIIAGIQLMVETEY